MARTLSERLRAHEQQKARLAEAEAKLKLDERKQRTRRLVEAGALVEKCSLLELDSSLGMDRLLKSNTSKTRTHSLFRQGCMLYDLIPTMPKHRLAPLIKTFAEAISNAGVLMPKLAVAK